MKGLALNVDLTGVTMSHALRIPPAMVKKYLYYVQEAKPVRLKAVHFMNTTPVVDFVIGLMKPFMKKELMDKVRYTLIYCVEIFFSDIILCTYL